MKTKLSILLFTVIITGSIFNNNCFAQATQFAVYTNCISVKTPSRTINQPYYEFWDSGLGWAGIRCGKFYSESMGIGLPNNNGTPLEKLDVNGKIRIRNADTYSSGWGCSYIHHPHSLIIGAAKGEVKHNILELKPGGCDELELYSRFQIYRSPKVGEHIQEIELSGKAGGINYINSGNLGIGTTTPNYKLDVNGTIHAREVKVDLNGWPDFVFQEDYKLIPLHEVEQFIKSNNHLPEIPNEEKVTKEGINLGEMNAKLLQKIEELTLYIIDLQKQINELKISE